ncbi:MAG: helix-turn-helix transcriptional regulator [Anaerostipes sp.]|nr:helix-turn-helix transcriptional regulator [Anaerostipes sp.]
MSEEDYKKAFSRNLREYMEVNGKTQADIVKELGFNKATVSTWVNGIKIPRMDKIDILCDYFGISRSDLIENRQKEKATYYLNEETKEIAQEIFENPDMKSLFDMSRKMTPERLKAHLEFMKKLQDSEKD